MNMLSFFEHTDSNQLSVEMLLNKEFQHTVVSYSKDGVVHVTYKSGCTITVEDCCAMAEFIYQIDTAKKNLFITESEHGSNIDD